MYTLYDISAYRSQPRRERAEHTSTLSQNAQCDISIGLIHNLIRRCFFEPPSPPSPQTRAQCPMLPGFNEISISHYKTSPGVFRTQPRYGLSSGLMCANFSRKEAVHHTHSVDSLMKRKPLPPVERTDAPSKLCGLVHIQSSRWLHDEVPEVDTHKTRLTW